MIRYCAQNISCKNMAKTAKITIQQLKKAYFILIDYLVQQLCQFQEHEPYPAAHRLNRKAGFFARRHASFLPFNFYFTFNYV